MDIEISEIFSELGVGYSDIGTHWLLKECPGCGKKDKVRVDKNTGKWICHKCYSDDEDKGKGNMWTLLPLYGLERYEIRTLLLGYSVPTYTDDFVFKSIEEEQNQQVKEELPLINIPDFFIPIDGTEPNYHRIPQAYGYLASRKVSNLNLIKKYRLMYSTIHKRIVFPFYDSNGRVVGWQGRDITNRWKLEQPRCPNNECELKRKIYFKGEQTAPELCPECGNHVVDHFYPKTLTSYGFQKQQLVINLNKIDPNKPVMLVEGPFDSINTPNSIPLLGKFLSDCHFQIIRNFKDVRLYFDGDLDGDKATLNVYRRLELFVPKLGIILNERGEDPGGFNYDENLQRIQNPISLEKWAFMKKMLV